MYTLVGMRLSRSRNFALGISVQRRYARRRLLKDSNSEFCCLFVGSCGERGLTDEMS